MLCHRSLIERVLLPRLLSTDVMLAVVGLIECDRTGDYRYSDSEIAHVVGDYAGILGLLEFWKVGILVLTGDPDRPFGFDSSLLCEAGILPDGPEELPFAAVSPASLVDAAEQAADEAFGPIDEREILEEEEEEAAGEATSGGVSPEELALAEELAAEGAFDPDDYLAEPAVEGVPDALSGPIGRRFLETV